MTFGVPVHFEAVLKVDAVGMTEAIQAVVCELNRDHSCVMHYPGGFQGNFECDGRFNRSILQPKPWEEFCNDGSGG